MLIGTGCAAPQPTAPVDPDAAAPEPPAVPEPNPPIVRPARVDLFGMLPSEREVPFEGRAAGALQQHTFTEVGGDFDADVDATGAWLVFASTRHAERPNLYLKSVTGRAVTQVTNDPASDVQPAFSPDGSRIAFVSDRGGSWDLWVLEINAGRPVQLTRDEGHEVHPSWAPDGQRLVYSRIAERGGPWELWVVDLSGPAKRKFIGQGLFPQWSPNGDKIAFQRARERGSRWFSIWTVELVDGEPRRPMEIASGPDQALIAPAWSPDGSRLAYCVVPEVHRAPETERATSGGAGDANTMTDPPSDVWIIDADGQSPIRLTDGSGSNYSPDWAGDGRIYFVSRRGGRENIWSVRPVTGGLLTAAPVQPGPARVRPVAHQLPTRAQPLQRTAPARPEAPPRPVAIPTRSAPRPNPTRPPAQITNSENAQRLPAEPAVAIPAVDASAAGS